MTIRIVNKPRESGPHATTEIDGQTVYMEDMIMERLLGRELADDETVFHHNSNTLDNRQQNLYLLRFGIDLEKETVQ